jgi:aminoglycoside/choline kinase family phosphotransferase
VLQGGDLAAVSAAVASLAWQQLQALPTSALYDLAWLTQDALQTGDEEQTALWDGLLQHYVQVKRWQDEPRQRCSIRHARAVHC